MRLCQVVLLGAVLFSTGAYADTRLQTECIKNRAAIDMGSGTFRVSVAEVNVCEQKILKVLFSAAEKTDFKADLDQSKNGMISEGAISNGVKVVEKFVEKAHDLQATEFFAVGTEVFRIAQNASAFIGALPKELNVKIISQEEEAKLGFYSAMTAWEGKQKKIAVWDIGGGSAQFVLRDQLGKFSYLFTKVGSSSAKKIARSMRGLSDTESPNPIGLENSKSVVTQLSDQVAAALSEKEKTFRKLKEFQIIGIGGIHFNSVYRQSGSTSGKYTISEVEAALAKQSEKTDAEIGGKYAVADAANLALILSYLKLLKITEVSVLNVNLTEGLLTYGIR